MTDTRPLPDVADPLTAPYWQAAREHRLVIQHCRACGYRHHPAGPVCPECLSRDQAWAPVSGTGTVWSYVVYHHQFHKGFADELPYNVALVQLDEGPMLITNVLVADPHAVAIGMRVTVAFADVTPEVTLVKFKPLDVEGDDAAAEPGS